MGGTAEGWKLVPRRDIFHVRFTFKGHRYEFSTGKRVESEAAERAAEIYADVVSGRWRPVLSGSASALIDVIPLWLEAIEAELDVETVDTYGGYARRWLKFFGPKLSDINRATAANLKRVRLAKVSAASVRKELSALRNLLAWSVEQQLITEAPVVDGVPKRATGTRVIPQRPDVELSEEQIETIFRSLPVRGRGGHLVRARFILAYETGLRPATLDELIVGEHWKKGATHLQLRDENDKARWGRPVPLTPRAMSMLDEAAPVEGPIFGKHDYRERWSEAIAAAGLSPTLVPYDLRHARIQHLIDAGEPLTGVAYLAGHTQLTTTNNYLRGSRKLAEKAVSGVKTGVGPLETVSAQEGNRTPKRVTSLEPERHERSHSSQKTTSVSSCVRSLSVDESGLTGVGPQSWVHEATANLLGLLAGVS